MEETTDRAQGARTDAEQSDAHIDRDLEADLEALNAEADQNRHTAPFRPLINFVKSHVRYLPTDAKSPEQHCPICRESTTESHERMLQVELPNCHHIFGADCLERYIQRSHTCPLCREMWFEERLTPEMPLSRTQLLIQVTVANQELANAFADALETDDGEIMRNLLRNRVTEIDDSEEDTGVSDTDIDEESDTDSGRNTNTHSVNSQAEVTRIDITSGSAMNEAHLDRGMESDISSLGRRTVVPLSGSDEGNSRTGDSQPASDDEVLFTPRQRRRYR